MRMTLNWYNFIMHAHTTAGKVLVVILLYHLISYAPHLHNFLQVETTALR